LRNVRALTQELALQVPLAAAHNRALALVLIHVEARMHSAQFSLSEAMVNTASRLRRCRSGDDWLYRFGVDEVIALVEGGNREDAESFTRRLRTALVPVERGESGPQPLCTLGMALCPDDGSTPALLLTTADLRRHAERTRIDRESAGLE